MRDARGVPTDRWWDEISDKFAWSWVDAEYAEWGKEGVRRTGARAKKMMMIGVPVRIVVKLNCSVKLTIMIRSSTVI